MVCVGMSVDISLGCGMLLHEARTSGRLQTLQAVGRSATRAWQRGQTYATCELMCLCRGGLGVEGTRKICW